MKKLILLLTVFFTCLCVKAQETTTDYIYSSDGFEVKTGVYNGVEYTGLYSKDGKTFVSAIKPSYENNFYIIDGCETIASGAFQYAYGINVYFPSTVKSIAPDALTTRVMLSGNSKRNFWGGIKDGVREQSGSGAVNAPTADPNATEVARYNVQGVRLSEPSDGVNIVQMSDGTAQKVLVR
ncbi:MAG: hypothetical protein K2M07_07395 [Muribaculaceae bacterium]|nr:hypothetical protein [Muribaculaceae bacterium]